MGGQKVACLSGLRGVLPPPLLISQHHLDIVAPGCPLQAVPASIGTMRGASGEPLPSVGGVNLLIRLFGASLTDRGDRAGPPCHTWYPINAMVVEYIDSGFILTALFIRKHQMQLSYKNPRPYIIFEEKKFPFFQNVQLIDKYGHIPLHPWERGVETTPHL